MTDISISNKVWGCRGPDPAPQGKTIQGFKPSTSRRFQNLDAKTPSGYSGTSARHGIDLIIIIINGTSARHGIDLVRGDSIMQIVAGCRPGWYDVALRYVFHTGIADRMPQQHLVQAAVVPFLLQAAVVPFLVQAAVGYSFWYRLQCGTLLTFFGPSQSTLAHLFHTPNGCIYMSNACRDTCLHIYIRMSEHMSRAWQQYYAGSSGRLLRARWWLQDVFYIGIADVLMPLAPMRYVLIISCIL